MTQIKPSKYRKKIEAQHQKIIEGYKELTTHNPGASLHSKAVALGELHGMTPEGIKRVLKIHGLYQPRTQEAQ